MVPSLPLYVLPGTSIETSPVSSSNQVPPKASPSVDIPLHENNDDSVDVPTEGSNYVDNDDNCHNFVDSDAHSCHTKVVDQQPFTPLFVSSMHSHTSAAAVDLENASHGDNDLQNGANEAVVSGDTALIAAATSNIHSMITRSKTAWSSSSSSSVVTLRGGATSFDFCFKQNASLSRRNLGGLV
ncbi:hypothetical protein V6N11_083901 [Hibiscus sabdariffa]|uniref:Uncharacterized protein n=1 Tax=Hibiscus sabdariffa TaxID=183260 RepID=A0ABR2QCY6_9ROSI